jgi:hypothetical protein
MYGQIQQLNNFHGHQESAFDIFPLHGHLCNILQGWMSDSHDNVVVLQEEEAI